MSTSVVKFDDRAINITFSKDALHFILANGREISAPLAWFPLLYNATTLQRNHWKLIGNGIGVHWPDVDEDIAVNTLIK